MTRFVRGFVATGWVFAILIALPARAGDTGWPDLSSPPSRTGGGENDVAVIVGVENYMFLPDIPGALTNVEDWYLYLTRTLAVPPARITLLRNEEATVEKMRKYAERAASEVDPGGTLWFVFVGHGAASSDGTDGVLIGADAQREADSVYVRSLPRSELLATLDSGAQERSVVVLDACFSGRSAGGEELVEGLQAYVPHRAARLGGDLAVLAAGRSDQFAGPLPGQVRPAFSYLVLGAMRGWGDADGNGSVTADEAVSYARDALATLVTDRDQTPELSGELGGTVLGRGRERGPDLAGMRLSLGPGTTAPTIGRAELSTGSDVDLAAAAAEAERLRREREALEEREREIQRQLTEERKRRRDEAESDLLDSARSEWLALAPLMESPSPESATVVELYVKKYGDASVTVDGDTTSVEVAYVDEAQDWLRRHAGKLVGGGTGGSVIDQHGYEMARIEPGEFWMGSPSDEEGREDDETRHKVRITKGFVMGSTEVSQALYQAVMGENPSLSKYKGSSLVGPEKPVQNVSWLDVVAFCNRLSEQEGLEPAYRISGETVTWDRSANGYRLPTEAEWEYAARAGGSNRYSGTSDDSSVCQYGNVSNPSAKSRFDWSWDVFSCEDGAQVASDVGSYQSNGWGLYDMTGNVWEWVWDWYGEYPSGTVTDPVGPSTGSLRVVRGGSWLNVARLVRVALRYIYDPGVRSNCFLGFRLARSVP